MASGLSTYTGPPTGQEEVAQFIKLSEAIREVQLLDDVEDEITWRWTADGTYSTQSTYQIQFNGKLNIMPI